MNYTKPQTKPHGYTDEQWQVRVDLAAAHRCAVMHGLHEGIFNHFTMRVPGEENRYYQIPFGTHWSEVTASCFHGGRLRRRESSAARVLLSALPIASTHRCIA